MNKDLDDRLIPNGEYRDALNVSINKSQGDGSSEGNVGTLQTVLGNNLLIDFEEQIPSTPSNVEVIGVLPSDNNDTLFAFLTNNSLKADGEEPYIPQGAVGITYLYPNNQDSTSASASLNISGSGYSTGTSTTTGGSGTGLTVNIIASAGVVTDVSIANPGYGYEVNDLITITQASSDLNATFTLLSTSGPISISSPGVGYTGGIKQTTGGNGSGLELSIIVNSSGSITSASIINFGGGYQVSDLVTVVDPSSTSPATITILSLLNSYSAIVSYNTVSSSNFKIIVEGSWLNFNTSSPIYGVNLIEDLLFFTDNRNQPRKVNINMPQGYYTSEDQISVAKYYPYESIQVYQPSNQTGAVGASGVSNSVTNSTTISLSSTSQPSFPVSNPLGVNGSLAQITNAGTGYSSSQGVATTGGTGRGCVLNVTASSGSITSVNVASIGSGYSNGDILTVTSGDNNAKVTLYIISIGTFIVDSTNWPNSVVVNKAQTIPSGMNISFTFPETSMQDASSEYLPTTATGDVAGTPTNLSFNLSNSSYEGYFNENTLIGHTVLKETTPGNFVSLIGIVTGASRTATVTQISCTALSSVPSVGDKILLAIPNPYYDADFTNTANTEYLKDKFIRFSYRFRFDDGEYSVMAPFTQPCFIPEQDGYFLGSSSGVFADGSTNEISDEEQAYRSTEVAFMENKVNKIFLNIPLPSSANSLKNEYKISEIDILYKESDGLSVKVVDSIPVESSVTGDADFYQYEYGSKSPFKTLPESEITRVFDKVPVRALSQEVASNRVIYGNYQDKHTPPSFLDYTLAVTPKRSFFVSSNEVDSYTSSIEYPNATLKQNRNFEVGVVLADRFGRQSTVIFSKQSEFTSLGEFLASSIYSPYRGANETVPTGGIQYFDGNALNIQFIDQIRSFRNRELGTPGLYNGDITSPDYNPTGWYSFKIVVKQTEQEYYNAYLPTVMAAYPTDREKELGSTSHVVLINDNINKIPRDLQEVGPSQREFRSSVRMFGRVAPQGSGNNQAYYPSKIADLSTTIATIKDLFDFDKFPAITTNQYLFYNFDYTTHTGGGTDINTFPDSSSLVARINTQDQFGIQVPTATYYSGKPALNVYEIEPTVSVLDIYYETSTNGRIDFLNKAIDDGPAPNQFSRFDQFSFTGSEDSQAGDDVSIDFKPVRLNGTDFPNPQFNTCTLTNVVDLNGDTSNIDNPSVPYFDAENNSNGIFKVVSGSTPGSFKLQLAKPAGNDSPGLVFRGPQNEQPGNQYQFDFLCGNTAAEGEPVVITAFGNLGNALPPRPNIDVPAISSLCTSTFPEQGDLPTGNTVQFVEVPLENVQNPGDLLANISNCKNGSSTVNLETTDLQVDIRNMWVATGYPNNRRYSQIGVDVLPSDYSNDPLEHWNLQISNSPGVFRELISGSGYKLNKPYVVEVATRDAVGYGNSCYASFIIKDQPSIRWYNMVEDNNTPIPGSGVQNVDFCSVSTVDQEFESRSITSLERSLVFDNIFEGNYEILGGQVKFKATIEAVVTNGPVQPLEQFKARAILNPIFNASNTFTNGQLISFDIEAIGSVGTVTTFENDDYIIAPGTKSFNLELKLDRVGEFNDSTNTSVAAKCTISVCDPSE